MQKNMKNWRKNAHPMDVLQAFVAALAGYYDEEFATKEASYERAFNLIAKIPTIVASWQRNSSGWEGLTHRSISRAEVTLRLNFDPMPRKEGMVV